MIRLNWQGKSHFCKVLKCRLLCGNFPFFLFTESYQICNNLNMRGQDDVEWPERSISSASFCKTPLFAPKRLDDFKLWCKHLLDFDVLWQRSAYLRLPEQSPFWFVRLKDSKRDTEERSENWREEHFPQLFSLMKCFLFLFNNSGRFHWRTPSGTRWDLHPDLFVIYPLYL